MESPLPTSQKYNILRSILKMEYEKELLNLTYNEYFDDQRNAGINTTSYIFKSFKINMRILKLKMEKIQNDIDNQKKMLEFGYF